MPNTLKCSLFLLALVVISGCAGPPAYVPQWTLRDQWIEHTSYIEQYSFYKKFVTVQNLNARVDQVTDAVLAAFKTLGYHSNLEDVGGFYGKRRIVASRKEINSNELAMQILGVATLGITNLPRAISQSVSGKTSQLMDERVVGILLIPDGDNRTEVEIVIIKNYEFCVDTELANKVRAEIIQNCRT